MKKEVQVVRDWQEETMQILDKDKNEEFDFAIVETLFKDSKKFRIQSVAKFQEALHPIIAWVEESSKFIERQSIRPRTKGKKKLDPSGKKPSEGGDPIKSAKDNKMNFTPYETLTHLALFFETNTEADEKMEVDPSESEEISPVDKEEAPKEEAVMEAKTEEAKEEVIQEENPQDKEMTEQVDDPQPEGELKESQPEVKEETKEENKEGEIEETKVQQDTVHVGEEATEQDVISNLKELIPKSEDRNQAVSDVIEAATYHKRGSKVFKIDLPKTGDKDSELQLPSSDKAQSKPDDKDQVSKKYLEIDDLLNDDGELKQVPHNAVAEDKELNEKLDILMRDLRGRARRLKFTSESGAEVEVKKPEPKVEKPKETKQLLCNKLPKNELSPPNDYWLKFDKVERLYNRVKEFLNVSKEWMQKCNDIILHGGKFSHPQYLFGTAEISLSDPLAGLSESIISSATNQVSALCSKKDQKGSVPIVYDSETMKLLTGMVDKLGWIKKLVSVTTPVKDSTTSPGVIKFKKLETLEKESKKIFKQHSDKQMKAMTKKINQGGTLQPNQILNLIYTDFITKFEKTNHWMQKLDQLRESANQPENAKESKSDQEDDLWTMEELELLIDLGKDMELVPTEYLDIQKIYKVAKDWRDKVEAVLNQVPELQLGNMGVDVANLVQSTFIELDDLVELKEETLSDKFEVDLPEITMLQNLIDLAKVWQQKAQKVLSSRSIYLQNYDYEKIKATCSQVIKAQHSQVSKKRDKKLIDKIEEEKEAKSEIAESKIQQLEISDHHKETLSLKAPEISQPKRQKLSELDLSSVHSEPQSLTAQTQPMAEVLQASGIFTYKDVYCVCCTPTQAGVSYIGCELCDDWFHFECIGLDPRHKVDQYVCKTCCLLTGQDYGLRTTLSQMEEEEFVRLVTLAPVNMKEKEMLQNVYFRAKLWSVEARMELERGIDHAEIHKGAQNSNEQTEADIRDKKLLKMLHECEIFPFQPEEKEPLLGLLKEIRYAKKVFNSSSYYNK